MKNYIYGKNTVFELLDGNRKIKEVFISSNFKEENILAKLAKREIKPRVVSNQVLDRMVSKNHQGIIADCEPFAYSDFDHELKKLSDEKNRLVLVLDGIEDPHNLGSIIRTADASGVDFIVIGTNRCCEVTPTVEKVSSGASSYVSICQVTNLSRTLEKLQNSGFWVVSADIDTKVEYTQVDYKMNVALVLGSEGKGISKNVLKKSDYVVKLPMYGHVNSLNVSVAAGILIYEVKKIQVKG